MDRLEELCGIIKDNLTYPWGKLYTYPDIPNKITARITKNFDSSINVHNIAAYVDTSLTNNGKSGMVFTTTGAYFKAALEKPFYFNYADIKSVSIQPDLNGNKDSVCASLELIFKNQTKLVMGSGDFNKSTLLRLLMLLASKASSDADIVHTKSTGTVEKVNLTENQQKICHGIIHGASAACGCVGTGLAQIPLVDTAVITPIQIGMVIALGKVFGIRVTEGAAKGIIAGAGASIVGRGAVQVLVGWIPFLGNAINTTTAAGLTEAIGWMAVAHFFDLEQQEKAKYRIDAMKQGYAAAAEEYEIKLRKQADLFIQQQKVYRAEVEQYKELIAEYEKYIRKLEKQAKKDTTALRTQYNQLTSLKVG